MKLVNARINNFRLLKELTLNFSTDPKKPLSVIRAANESGKTTIKNALLWGLYGSAALPGKGSKYVLCPSDAINQGKRKVEISVEIEFLSEQVVYTGKSSTTKELCHFRLKRSCFEYPSKDGTVRREAETRILYRITPEGTSQVPEIEVDSIIESSIPFALKDVYFTDGDQAMTFIEAGATRGTKRRRVKDAIESLLGLNVLESTIAHLGSAAKIFSQQIDNRDYASELEKLNDRIGGYEEDIQEWNETLANLESDVTEGEKDFKKTNKRVEELLKLGDRETLAGKIRHHKQRIQTTKDDGVVALKSLSGLTRNAQLANSVVSEVALEGLGILQELSDKKQLPKVSIPILEELLERDDCFCGESLTGDSIEGKQRRKSIEKAIHDSQSADILQEAATTLFFSVRSEPFDNSASEYWLRQYSSLDGSFSKARNDEIRLSKELKDFEAEIDRIDDSALEQERELQQSIRTALDRARMRTGELTSAIRDASSRKRDAEGERSTIERKLNKTDTSSGKLHVSRACISVFARIFSRLTSEELIKVSDEMNRIFLEMIGSNPEANDLTLITKAELTTEFDILVYGPNNNQLNPDQDLNGASRRAITLAFILALTKISEVEAPNVIDTPLGMMSGFVKRSVLRKCIDEGSQTILFLTHDEINGVENILSDKAGAVFTLTSPAHYPEILVNKPTVKDARVMRCECSHLQHCSVCERKPESREVAA